MKALSFASILGIVGFTLMISACSDEKNAFNTNECPKNALCLYKNVSFSQNIMPNAYKASIRITESDTLRKGGEIESATKKDIANTLNDIITLSKRKGFCEGGNHDLRPNIQYKDGAARDTVGYTLSFSLECDVPSKQKKDYDAFGGALKLAKESAQEYSKILDKKCTLVSADAINNTLAPREFAKVSNMSASSDVSWELPSPKEQEITAKIQVKYICK